MTDVKHTPGPWVVDEVRTDAGRACRIGAGEMLKAGKGCCIIYDDYGHGANQRAANARLISTAPDGLALARAVIREHENLDDRAPAEHDCGYCNLGTGPHRVACAYHQAKLIVAKVDWPDGKTWLLADGEAP